MSAKHTPMVVAAARELCRQHAETCCVNERDAWNVYSGDFKADAQKVLDACGAPDLLEALQEVKQLLDMVLCVQGGLPPNANGPAAKALAAIRKATGGAS